VKIRQTINHIEAIGGHYDFLGSVCFLSMAN